MSVGTIELCVSCMYERERGQKTWKEGKKRANQGKRVAHQDLWTPPHAPDPVGSLMMGTDVGPLLWSPRSGAGRGPCPTTRNTSIHVG